MLQPVGLRLERVQEAPEVGSDVAGTNNLLSAGTARPEYDLDGPAAIIVRLPGYAKSVERRSFAVFPWSTFTINVTGCLLIGIVVASLERSRSIVASRRGLYHPRVNPCSCAPCPC